MSWVTLMEQPVAEQARVIEGLLRQAEVPSAKEIGQLLAPLMRIPVVVVALPRIAEALRHAGSPLQAARSLSERVAEMESAGQDASPLFWDPVLMVLLQLSGASTKASRVIAQDPSWVVELGERLRTEDPDQREAFEGPLGRLLQVTRGDTEAFDRGLRRFRNRQMLRLAAIELRDNDVRRSAAELAELASAVVQAALSHHLPILEASYGVLDPPCAHTVIGMGKLGGGELNFSSDIDLIYLYAHDEGGSVKDGETTLTNHEFFVKLFERVTQSVGRITEEGFVFRVDLDLRPEGRTGPLANSLGSAERYYQTWGRTWERFAWTRARPIAGDPELGEQVKEMMRPFVYRRSLDISAIQNMVDMKAELNRQHKSPFAKNRTTDIKLDKGGIREIEFFVQALLMLHGGRDPSLRQVNTLIGLSALEARGHISAKIREQLANAYLFLRKVEHRVQIVEEQQVHHLPSSLEAQLGLARSLGFDSADALTAALQSEMEGVSRLFSGLLSRAEEREEPPREVLALLDPEEPEAAKLDCLVEAGCLHPHASLASLKSCQRIQRGPWHPRASAEHRRIAEHLLAECLQSPSSDRALRHLPELGRVMAVHGQYLSDLKRPTLRRGVARLLGASELLARILVSSPSLLSRVLSSGRPPSLEALRSGLSGRFAEEDDVEQALIALRVIKQEEILHTALAELSGQLTDAEIAERLTELAEVLLGACLRLAEIDIEGRYGKPEDPNAALVVLAGGTLGAYEMDYLGDVDLSLIFVGEGQSSGGSREAVSLPEYYTRLAQRFLSFLSMRTPFGDLYQADVRLRPSGSQGALVVELANFRAYHRKQAALWERQALLRTRPILGEPSLLAKVEAAIEEAAYLRPVPEDAFEQVQKMRNRIALERASDRTHRQGERLVDLKLGQGGLIEAEFVTQVLQITRGAEARELRHTATRRALKAAGALQLLDSGEAERVISAHTRLGRIKRWVRVIHDRMMDRVDLADADFRSLALAVGYQGPEAEALLERDLKEDQQAIHDLYLKCFEDGERRA